MTRLPDASAAGRERRSLEDIALVLTALGFGVRFVASLGSSLGPDEALHFELAGAPDLATVYRSSLSNAHPPLFFLLLHGWETVARSEWALRLLPVACGTAFLWFARKWTTALFGRTAGLLALAVLAFLPSVVLLSGELRAYSLLLLFAAAALAALERAFEARSPWRMWLSAGLMSLAMLTHYSAPWVVLAAAAYGVARIAADRPAFRFVRAWAGAQALVAALFLFLFATHLSRLRGGPLERQAQAETLRAGYFHAGAQSPIEFVLRGTASIFRFLFGSAAAGGIALLLAFGGLLFLAARRRPAALLLSLPFLLGAAGGLLGLYPYAGTRHAIYLALFAAAALAAGLDRLTAARAWPSLALAAALAPFCVVEARQAAEERPVDRMRSAVKELGAIVPAGSVLLADAGTASVMGYYLGGREAGPSPQALPGVLRRRAGAYEIVLSPVWSFGAATFAAELSRLVDAGSLQRGRPFWIVQMDWGFGAAEQVARIFPGARFPVSRRFERIALLEVEIPPIPRAP